MKKILPMILFLALILRFGTALWWEARTENLTQPMGTLGSENQIDGPFFFGDSDTYWKLGRNIAFGRPYQFDPERNWKIFRMPGYPIALAPLFLLGGENPPVFWGRLLGVFWGVATVFFTALLAWKITRSRETALLAALFAAIDPSLNFESVLILSDEMFTAALLCQLLLLVTIIPMILSYKEKETRIKLGFFSILFGLVSAVTVYIRPGWLDFIPFAATGMIGLVLLRKIFSKQEEGFFPKKKVVISRILLFVTLSFLIFVLSLVPWWIRNHQISGGHFIATTLQGGASLYDGLSPQATGASNMDFVDSFREKTMKFFPVPQPQFNAPEYEWRLDQEMKKEAVDWAKSHPQQVAKLGWKKVQRLWNLWPNEPSFQSLPIKLMILLSYGPIFILALVAAVITFRLGLTYWLLWLPALYITALHTIFVSSLRYRIPVMPELMILAAWLLICGYRKYCKSPSVISSPQ